MWYLQLWKVDRSDFITPFCRWKKLKPMESKLLTQIFTRSMGYSQDTNLHHLTSSNTQCYKPCQVYISWSPAKWTAILSAPKFRFALQLRPQDKSIYKCKVIISLSCISPDLRTSGNPRHSTWQERWWGDLLWNRNLFNLGALQQLKVKSLRKWMLESLYLNSISLGSVFKLCALIGGSVR